MGGGQQLLRGLPQPCPLRPQRPGQHRSPDQAGQEKEHRGRGWATQAPAPLGPPRALQEPHGRPTPRPVPSCSALPSTDTDSPKTPCAASLCQRLGLDLPARDTNPCPSSPCSFPSLSFQNHPVRSQCTESGECPLAGWGGGDTTARSSPGALRGQKGLCGWGASCGGHRPLGVGQQPTRDRPEWASDPRTVRTCPWGWGRGRGRGLEHRQGRESRREGGATG